MAGPLPHIPPLSRITPLILRITGGNPGKFTLQGTNTYLLGRGSERLLIDTGQGFPVWAKLIRDILATENAVIKTVLLTHHHHDHTGGLKDVPQDYKDLEIWRHPALPSNDQYRDMLTEVIDAYGGEINPLKDGQVFEIPGSNGATVKTIHTPGHTPDHCTFLLQHAQSDGDDYPILFTGDVVLGHGTAVFEDLTTYIASLHKIRQILLTEAADLNTVRAFPAHGEVIEFADAKLQEYIEHRARREQEVLSVLMNHQKESASGSPGLLPMDIVKVIYKEYPEALHIPAEGGTKLVLEKLKNDKQVIQIGERWVLTNRVGTSVQNSTKAEL